jgi:glucosamine--fructose-6-phosphate aminotransferase (isomerizing)
MSTFLAEIYSQPDVVAASAKSTLRDYLSTVEPLLGDIQRGKTKRLVFTGMGSSCSCVYPSVLRLLTGGVDARVVEASELIHFQSALLRADTLLVAISQSGRSAEMTPILDLAADSGTPVLGITNAPGSPLYERSSHAVLMNAGAEATVSTKTYTCTLAILHLLVSAILGEDTDEAFGAIQQVTTAIHRQLEGWETQMTALADDWEDTPFVEFLGRGYSMASANTAALIAKESIKIPTEGMNAGQFRHGPLELVDSRFTGMLFVGGAATQDMNIRLAGDIVSHGGRLALISPTQPPLAGAEWITIPDCPPDLLPLAEIIPVQLFCAAMAVRQGYEAGQFRYISKVTVQE